MLGFSPLASAPLGDDGAVVVYELVGNGITAGQPVVGSPAIAQEHDLTLTAITTG